MFNFIKKIIRIKPKVDTYTKNTVELDEDRTIINDNVLNITTSNIYGVFIIKVHYQIENITIVSDIDNYDNIKKQIECWIQNDNFIRDCHFIRIGIPNESTSYKENIYQNFLNRYKHEH